MSKSKPGSRGPASLVYFHFGDSYFTTLAQEAGVNLDLAIKEFHNHNNRGALEFLEIVRAEVAAAIAKAPDKSKSKPKLDAVAKDLDSFKTMIEQNDKKADDFLKNKKLVERIGKLSEEQ